MDRQHHAEGLSPEGAAGLAGPAGAQDSQSYPSTAMKGPEP